MKVPPLKMNRPIEGISAVLLPFLPDGTVDWDSYAGLVESTWKAGLTPAVNMDTGYVNLLSPAQRTEVLSLVNGLSAGRRFVAGAFIEGQDGDPVRHYLQQCNAIQCAGGVPILFPCSRVKSLPGPALVDVFRLVARECEAFLGFELGEMFVSFGRIWDLETYRALLDIPQLKGAKHSSLSRILEWERLRIRDEVRPDFRIYTGNDLAIDMVQWGSDYLLGLSAFHVEAFALRDRYWEQGDARFHELNDWLQYLGMMAFRSPVPSYKHSCAQFLHLRGRVQHPLTHPTGGKRPESDVSLLQSILEQVDARLDGDTLTGT